jgi:hypothetical protein
LTSFPIDLRVERRLYEELPEHRRLQSASCTAKSQTSSRTSARRSEARRRLGATLRCRR